MKISQKIIVFVCILAMIIGIGIEVYIFGNIVKTKIGVMLVTEDLKIPTSSLDGDEEQKMLSYIWGYLPKGLVEKFKEDNWSVENMNKINIDDYTLESVLPENSDAMDLTTYGTIYLDDSDIGIIGGSLHEFGHYMDISEFDLSQEDDWIAVYKEEKKKLECHTLFDPYIDTETEADYCRQNEKEFFAECFEQYILFPNSLQKCCPQAYKYMKDLVGRYSK